MGIMCRVIRMKLKKEGLNDRIRSILIKMNLVRDKERYTLTFFLRDFTINLELEKSYNQIISPTVCFIMLVRVIGLFSYCRRFRKLKELCFLFNNTYEHFFLCN